MPNGFYGFPVPAPEAASPGAMVLIWQYVVTSAVPKVSFANIPQGFTHLSLMWGSARSSHSATDNIFMRFNGDAGSNYDNEIGAFQGTISNIQESFAQTAAPLGGLPGTNAAAGLSGNGQMWILDYTTSSFNKTIVGHSNLKVGTSTTNLRYEPVSAYWRNNAPITLIDVFAPTGNLLAGVIGLYGVR